MSHRKEVAFSTEKSEMSERKQKYLTAKYGQHQMSLIKKRLKVEMWMCDQLVELQCPDVDIDIDELLDVDSDRRAWLRNKVPSTAPKERVERFIGELLARAETL